MELDEWLNATEKTSGQTCRRTRNRGEAFSSFHWTSGSLKLQFHRQKFVRQIFLASVKKIRVEQDDLQLEELEERRKKEVQVGGRDSMAPKKSIQK